MTQQSLLCCAEIILLALRCRAKIKRTGKIAERVLCKTHAVTYAARGHSAPPRARSRPQSGAPLEIRHGPASPRSSLPSRDADVFATERHASRYPRCLKCGFRIRRKPFAVSRAPAPDRHDPIERILRSRYPLGHCFGLEAVWQRLNSKKGDQYVHDDG